jgi:hypothetical protein
MPARMWAIRQLAREQPETYHNRLAFRITAAPASLERRPAIDQQRGENGTNDAVESRIEWPANGFPAARHT